MKLEKGDIKRPTGNLIVYGDVIGENPFQDGAKIIAANVFVSYLNHGDSLPVVSFPPVPIVTKRLLMKIINQGNYDLFKMDNFESPEDPGLANKYIKGKLREFNDIVSKYVEKCSVYLSKLEKGKIKSFYFPEGSISSS